jgi:hypothetical protein
VSHKDALNAAHDNCRPFCFFVRYANGHLSVQPYYFDRLGAHE